MTTPPTGGNGQIMPIPDQRHVRLTTYDAKDPDTKYPPITMLRPHRLNIAMARR
jgi:hypothetical protein